LKDRFGIDSDLKVGNLGDFEVLLDGQMVFSKHAKNRFPETGEVEQQIGTMINKD